MITTSTLLLYDARIHLLPTNGCARPNRLLWCCAGGLHRGHCSGRGYFYWSPAGACWLFIARDGASNSWLIGRQLLPSTIVIALGSSCVILSVNIPCAVCKVVVGTRRHTSGFRFSNGTFCRYATCAGNGCGADPLFSTVRIEITRRAPQSCAGPLTTRACI